MKFAAKKTWPDKATTWEHQGEAGDVQSFALEFAILEQLTTDTEFVVMRKDGDSQEAWFFRVAETAPYRLEPAGARTGGSGSRTPAENSGATGEGDEESAPVGMPSLRPFISMLFYMGKVAFIAIAGVALMAVVITQIRKAFG
ncbi:MAG: hypothetical protein ACUVT0_06135 [Thermochromatium sp.]